MAKINFLLGKGERLTEDVRVISGGGDKASPYTFSEAKKRLQPMLRNVVEKIENLPDDACPNDYAIATITLNPEYIAKSYYPSELLRAVGLETVGSKPKQILPAKRSKGRKPELSLTTEIFVYGKRKAFRKWAKEFSEWSEYQDGAAQIIEIEEISFPEPSNKIKDFEDDGSRVVFEVVLHMNEAISESFQLGNFREYLEKLGVFTSFDRRFYAGGLCFLEIEAAPDLATRVAEYSLIRVMRKMPELRLLRPTIRSVGSENSVSIVLPEVGPMDPTIKVAIFDGGIPADHELCKWATPYEYPDMLPASDQLLAHGVGVTSAFLFGHIDPRKPLPRPYSFVDHYRVLDDTSGQNPYELFEVLNRIEDILRTNRYEFINLSLGPCLPIEDDEVHAWTAVLDGYLSDGETLATIAVGNDGEGDPLIRANRVQVPSDCVNAIAVGACDVPDANWQRAPYSSVGPGRSPGLIKPDLVDFGGSIQRPFLTLDHTNGLKLTPTGGTSFSSPSALRLGSGVRAHFGNSLNALAIKTLLIHSAERVDLPMFEVGWGRIARTLDDIVVCEDHIMRVVFQGSISASKYIRVPIPLPAGQLSGKVTIKATLCYATDVDPHHPGNYTRSGLEVTFRPNRNSKRKVKEGENEPLHASSKTFFGNSAKAAQTEDELRRDAWKWENCIHAQNRFLGKSLVEPVFDIHYNARMDGHNDTKKQELQYALVVTVEAPKVTDLYDQVVRRYATQLEQLQPVIDIPVRIR
ncbi:S8 family peptidase [[Flexibacter] sp. ATCC 35208]|uniref:S8 family peptidase n=1 Tax=[Flexibacter] sp. ATCC 35208 TaxID=1936242 RepID=UPI0009C69C04|nr:S8 family peptidase [[Flexibacter] sp. ATCC 35208]OMP76271.1 peptidase S8 and S53, subtilisin, kexin, sedolisin [[Flexibacter] sp. ATCC 35208]